MDTVKCKHCSSKVEIMPNLQGQYIICPECSNDIWYENPGTLGGCQYSEDETPEEEETCMHCGAAILPEDKVCSHCGRAHTPREVPPGDY